MNPRYYLDRDAIGIFSSQLRDRQAWTWEEQDATVAQFRKLIHESTLDDSIRLAQHAGRQMAKCLARVSNTVRNLSFGQIEEWRRRYGVPKNRVSVMLCVAWSSLHYPRKAMPREAKAIGQAAPRTAAKQMIQQYGFQAEKMTRKMSRLNANDSYWKQVGQCLREERRAA